MKMCDVFDFSNKTIVVTGGSSGIGRQTAILLSEQGAKIVLIARRENQLKETMEQLSGDGHSYYVADLSEVEKIESLVKKIVEEQGAIFGLAYCAGIAQTMPLKMANPNYVEKMMKINYYAFYEMVRHLTKKGRYAEGARIVAISSVAGVGFWRGQSVYGASKAAMESTIRVAGQELIPKGITINAVRPGWVNTDMYIGFKKSSENADDTITQQQPLGLIEPTEVAGMIAYLMSPLAKSITGQAIQIGGGMTIK